MTEPTDPARGETPGDRRYQRPTNLHGPDDPEMEELLTRALRSEADAVQPGDRLDRIRTEARRQGRATGRTVLGVVAASLVLVVGGAVVGTLIVQQNSADRNVSMAGGASSGAPNASSAPTAASPAPPDRSTASGSASSESTGKLTSLPVYRIGPNDKLFREFTQVPDRGGRAVTAVREMLGSTPLDPDYQRGPWAPAAATSPDITVTQSGESLTVSLPATAFDTSRPVSKARATAAIQQLVWTVTAAVQAQGPVTVLIDGAAGSAWGQVPVGTPMSRDNNARSAVWILDPTEGQTLRAGTVTVKGNSRAFEGTVQWKVTRPDGSVVAESHTMGGANETYADFSFTTTLTPGTYLVTVFAPDMSGQRRDVGSDTKTVVVR